MAHQGPEFISITSGDELGARLREALGVLAADGGVIYLRPGLHWLTGDPVLIPANVLLWFAPGAVVVTSNLDPEGGQIFEPLRPTPRTPGMVVLGALRAAPVTIFATAAWTAAVHGGRPGGVFPGVRFAGRRVTRLRPEWWGGGSVAGNAEVDTEALSWCLGAALPMRELDEDGVTVIAARANPLEVELTRPLLLSRSLRTGLRSTDGNVLSNATSVLLRGRAAPGSPPSIRCAETFPLGDVMFRIIGPSAVRFTDVSLDGAGRASACLSVQPSARGRPERGQYSFRGCGFAGATETLVSLVHLYEGAPRTSPKEQAARRTEAFRFTGCTFDASARDAARSALAVALRNGQQVVVEASRFQGRAGAMVHVAQGGVTLVGNTFDNAEPPRKRGVGGLPGGCDVFLGDGEIVAGPKPMVSTGLPVRERSAVALGCVSRSWSFLVTDEVPVVFAGDTHLVGLLHQNAWRRNDATAPVAPGVVWDGPGYSGRLLVAGSHFVPAPNGSPGDRASLRAPIIVGSHARRIFDLDARWDGEGPPYGQLRRGIVMGAVLESVDEQRARDGITETS